VRQAKTRQLERDIEPYAARIARHYIHGAPKEAAMELNAARRAIRVPRHVDFDEVECRLQEAISRQMEELRNERERPAVQIFTRRATQRITGRLRSLYSSDLSRDENRRIRDSHPPRYEYVKAYNAPAYDGPLEMRQSLDYYARNRYRS